MSWRPKTIAEIPARVIEGEDFSLLIREFVDEVLLMSASQAGDAVAKEPQGPWKSELHKPFLAAMAEHYARKAGAPVPDWVWGEDCFLSRPHFGSSLQSLKAHLLISSPPAFRRRMIFMDRDPIPRAPRPTEFTEVPRPKRILGTISVEF